MNRGWSLECVRISGLGEARAKKEARRDGHRSSGVARPEGGIRLVPCIFASYCYYGARQADRKPSHKGKVLLPGT